MYIKTLYSKIHCALCTESRLDYMGSITIDKDWMDEARLHNGQAVDVVNIDNGARITTYVIAGKRGDGDICLNGAAAHHFAPGDKIIIICYCNPTLEEKQNFEPKVLLFNDYPPFEIISEKNKLKWLQGIPKYNLLKEEKPIV